jgi:hypothetical protein
MIETTSFMPYASINPNILFNELHELDYNCGSPSDISKNFALTKILTRIPQIYVQTD